ncbi:glycoside hydrolase superfamily [Bisporella sp. PMI_857]|nr:glycoside hydrolase superfamily [Bisporella sp. PMI_857]
MYQADYEAKFRNAKGLAGTNGAFTSARIYTTIQGGSSTNEPTQAIPAAISQDISLLLGLWASGGEGYFQAEIIALKSAITQYGSAFTSRVAGISVGSEDLYRISPTGIAANSGYGANPDVVARYIGELRSALAGTALSGASIGHVDTWTAWVNSSNNAVIDAADWIGFDGYPYFQNTQSNGIENGKTLFDAALAATRAAVGGKPVWITETGWPVSGKTENLAVPNTANAETYWKEVGCPLFGNVNTWWYTQQDSDPVTPNPSFGVIGSSLSTTPLYDLSCSAVSSSSSTPAAPSSTSSVIASSASSASSAISSSASSASSLITSAIGGGSTTSAVASSVVSSVSTAATGGAIASSGGGLGPVVTVPSVINPSAIPTGTGSGSGSGSGLGGNSTSVSTPTSPVSTSPTEVPAGAAVALSGSPMAAFALLLAAIVAL